jgi:hypothetical protein
MSTYKTLKGVVSCAQPRLLPQVFLQLNHGGIVMWQTLKCILLTLVVSGCGTSGNMESGALTVTKSSRLEFEATYTQGAQWAKVKTVMGMRGLSWIETSTGQVLANDGLLSDAQHDQGFKVITAGSPESELVSGLFNALLDAGANPRPDENERGLPIYKAAYACARVLDLQKVRDAFGDTRVPDSHEIPTVFPLPGWDREDLVPAEALQADAGLQLLGFSRCCGDVNCWGCDPDTEANHGACADWCAAGDHCNQFHHWCGNKFCGVACPHTCPDGDQPDTIYSSPNPSRCSTVAASYCYFHTPPYEYNSPHVYNCGGW